MAAVPPPFDPGSEHDPRESELRERSVQPAGQQPGPRQRAGYLLVAVLLFVL
jgi:hypothetical protein